MASASLWSSQKAENKSASNRVQRRVLLVEDNLVNQQILTMMLNRLGCTVDCADNGTLAVTRVACNNYAVVFMDFQLPGFSGLEATQAIRALPPPQNRVPIVALSACALAEERERCLEGGMDMYLTKPVFLEQLEKVLRLIPPYTDEDKLPDPETGASSVSVAPVSVDPSVLQAWKEIAGEDSEDFLGTIVNSFLAEAPKHLAEIETGLRSRDAARLKYALHRLKGTSSNLGAVAIADLCRQIEEAKEPCVESLSPWLRALRVEIGKVGPELRAVCAQTDSRSDVR